MQSEITPKELAKYFEHVGRVLPMELVVTRNVQYVLQRNERRSKISRRYSRRVWSRFSLPDYLKNQANLCADFMMTFAAPPDPRKPPILDGSFYLKNPHGDRYHHLGYIRLHRPAAIVPTGITESDLPLCPAIERIDLHPSLQRKGFLTQLAQSLKTRGARFLILQSVFNPSLAYHLYERSLQPDSCILNLTPERVTFGKEVSPGLDFAWCLNDHLRGY